MAEMACDTMSVGRA